MKDYYEILGVDKSATFKEIKAAHRKLVKKHHPDKNGGEHSEEFINIQQAYTVLSDDKERALYDEYGFSHGDSDITKIQVLVADMLCRFISKNIPPTQIVFEMERELETGVGNLTEERLAQEDAIDKFRAQKDSLKATDGLKLDIIGNTLMELIRQTQGEINLIKHEIEIRDKLLDMISNYEKTGELPEVMGNFGGLSGQGEQRPFGGSLRKSPNPWNL